LVGEVGLGLFAPSWRSEAPSVSSSSLNVTSVAVNVFLGDLQELRDSSKTIRSVLAIFAALVVAEGALRGMGARIKILGDGPIGATGFDADIDLTPFIEILYY
jgi:hypothetical protein